jgi:hypothetical protein
VRSIWKFPLASTAKQGLEVPTGARFLSCQMQDGVIAIWFDVDTAAPLATRIFLIVGTGQKVPDDAGDYLATVQDDAYVWHLFAKAPRGDS